MDTKKATMRLADNQKHIELYCKMVYNNHVGGKEMGPIKFSSVPPKPPPNAPPTEYALHQ